MSNLDPFLLHLPPEALEKPLMLEASAGTGKTYTLTRLLLAYLLYQNIPIDKILVITFTRNATAELKDRMSQLLHESLDNPDLSGEIKDKLIQIIADFDNLSIITIDSFLQQTFQNSCLETAANPQLRPTEDNSWLNEAAHDYFRRFGALFDEERRMQLSLLAFSALAKMKNSFGGEEPIKDFSDCFPWLIDNILNKAFLREYNIFPGENESEKAWETEEKYAGGKSDIFTIFHRLRREQHRGLAELNLSQEMMAKTASLSELLILLGTYKSKTSKSPWNKLCGKNIRKKYPALQELYEVLFPLVDNGKQKNPHLAAMASHFLRHFHHHTNFILKDKEAQLNVMRLGDPTAYLYDLLHKDTDAAWLHKLRRRHCVALIDEFQDTNHFQWTILHKLFQPTGTQKNTYALIGDPKQLIYYFRGSTPETYAQAKNLLPRQQVYQLRDNFRSHETVLAGINFWFSHIFAHTSHGYTAVRAANETVMRLQAPALEKQAGITFLACENPPALLTSGKAKNLAYALCVQQIYELLHNEDYQLIDDVTGECRRVHGADIACLVSTHREGKELKNVLDAWYIPGTLLENNSSIYETEEYEHVLIFLKALALPFSAPLRNRVLLSPLFGLFPQQLLPTQENLALLEEFYVRFNTWRHAANSRKIAQVFDQIFYQYGYFERLMAHSDGERRFVNMRHLVSILLREERTAGQGSGPNYLYQRLKTLKEQRRKEDNARIRLETDSDAVRILTIHQAKGLEYGIVFGIFGIKQLPTENTEYAIQKDQKPILDMALGEEHSHVHMQENMQENMRKFYVMATRAKSHLFLPLIMTKLPSYYSHALSYLANETLRKDIISADKDIYAEKAKNLYTQIQDLDKDPDSPFSCLPMVIQEQPCAQPRALPREILEDLSAASLRHASGFNRRIRHISSYTSLWQNKQSEEDEDYMNEIINDEDESFIDDAQTRLTPLNLGGGTSLGNAFHGIMENLPFHFANTPLENFLQDPFVQDVADIMISRHMSVNYHYDKDYIKTVKEMVWNSLNTPIAQLGNLRLAELNSTDKLHEVEFLLHIPQSCTLQTPSFCTQIKGGYLRGFLDLIFIHNDRYFVVDWKTTRLGSVQSSYAAEYLPKAMTEHGYDMQALIYTHALCEYLRTKGNKNEEKIGSVIYIFSRGANPAYPGDGLDVQQPSKENIQRLFINS